MTGGVFDVTVIVEEKIAFPPNSFSPGITVWASGASPFNGGSLFGWTEVSLGHATPHSFNATGELGAAGTHWMKNGEGGNLIEILGYANSGPGRIDSGGGLFTCMAIGCPTVGMTAWGNDILPGANDVSITNNFENGVSGSVSRPFNQFDQNFAELTFNDLQPGWYVVFVGGGNEYQATGGFYNLTISAAPVPEMETWAMMLAGLGFFGWRMKRQQQELMAASV